MMSSFSYSSAKEEEICWTKKKGLWLNIVMKQEEEEENVSVKGEEEAQIVKEEDGTVKEDRNEDTVLGAKEGEITVTLKEDEQEDTGDLINTTNMESKARRTRKPNWTEEQCLMLAQLVDEHKTILKGKFGPGVTARDKKQRWEQIAQIINGSFPLLVRTSEDCEKRWYVLQSKAREEIAAHKRESSRTGGGPPAKQLSQVAQTVLNIFGHSETSITGLIEGTDSSMIQLVELQKCSTEPSEEEWRPSKSQMSNPQPEAPHSLSSAATAPAPTPSLMDKKLEMEMAVLKQQKIVLHLQEEYYKLKIELLRNKTNNK
ncbi:hypothetical protein UPYG_G00055680 [Umbra pygmaea]|uniref:Myb-like domain-containing protein n=1 Tax=Umbra pygmaea TaxID=75934 RepID=A0ABD0XT57_UMBPY